MDLYDQDGEYYDPDWDEDQNRAERGMDIALDAWALAWGEVWPAICPTQGLVLLERLDSLHYACPCGLTEDAIELSIKATGGYHKQ